jgi:uncharacterized protein YkwD
MMRNALCATLITGAVLVLPAAAQADCPNEGAAPTEITMAEASDSLLCLMNERRSDAGVRPLRSDGRLERAARRHSNAMGSHHFFSHSSPADGSPLGRIRSTGYLSGASNWGIAENLHWGSGGPGTPRVTVSRWMSSPAHRTPMLSPRFRHVGIGIAIGAPTAGVEDAAIYTANFGYRR